MVGNFFGLITVNDNNRRVVAAGMGKPAVLYGDRAPGAAGVR